MINIDTNAMWLASILGPFLVIMGLWIALHTDEVRKLWRSMEATPGVFYLSGLINLLIGLVVISLYCGWSWNLALLVTILGYVALIRGILMLFATEAMVKWSAKIVRHRSLQSWSLLPIVWGVLLCWLAFVT